MPQYFGLPQPGTGHIIINPQPTSAPVEPTAPQPMPEPQPAGPTPTAAPKVPATAANDIIAAQNRQQLVSTPAPIEAPSMAPPPVVPKPPEEVVTVTTKGEAPISGRPQNIITKTFGGIKVTTTTTIPDGNGPLEKHTAIAFPQGTKGAVNPATGEYTVTTPSGAQAVYDPKTGNFTAIPKGFLGNFPRFHSPDPAEGIIERTADNRLITGANFPPGLPGNMRKEYPAKK